MKSHPVVNKLVISEGMFNRVVKGYRVGNNVVCGCWGWSGRMS